MYFILSLRLGQQELNIILKTLTFWLDFYFANFQIIREVLKSRISVRVVFMA